MLYGEDYKEFISKLDLIQNKEIYARVTALTFAELPTETIEGRVTGGSINVDGASAIRRSCSLTITAQNFKYNNYYWGLNSKFKLEIGIKNTIDTTHMPDIIWFNQGIYLITTFNTSRSTNNLSISLSGKDKMCLLNGEIGGTLESTVDFGSIEEEDINGVWTIRSLPIVEIIRNMVHTYAGEPYHNIVINDLNSYGLELLEYRYDTPLYLYRPWSDTNEITDYYNLIMENDNLEVTVGENTCKLKDIPPSHLDTLVTSLTNTNHSPGVVKVNNKHYIFAKVEYGQTAGYRITDLTYPGTLVANAGESITSVLDKIKNILAEFEYFYDLDGRFVFQKKKSFISTMWSPSDDEQGQETVKESLALATSNAYIFKNNQIISAFNNNPNLANLRNDYSIWGERTGISGAAIPIHLRYAIDKKPTQYTQITVTAAEVATYNEKYHTTLKPRASSVTYIATNGSYSTSGDKVYCDWREVIYQMASDYYKYNFLDDFEIKVAQKNPNIYPTGQTGYERYYIDIQGFWRQIYNPEWGEKIANKEAEIRSLESSLSTTQDAANKKIIQADIDEKQEELETLKASRDNFYMSLGNNDSRLYWHKNVYEHPEMINFWFDFLDTEGQLQQFGVKNIGSRSKTVNETSIKSIYFRETPAVVFKETMAYSTTDLSGYKKLQIPERILTDMFTISSQGKSAKERLDELIYAHGYCIDSASITTLPIYYLDVNTRIYIHNDDSNIDGDYIVNKLTIPLTYNGTMSISATKAAENILH